MTLWSTDPAMMVPAPTSVLKSALAPRPNASSMDAAPLSAMPSVTRPTPNHCVSENRFPPTNLENSAAKAMDELKSTA